VQMLPWMIQAGRGKSSPPYGRFWGRRLHRGLIEECTYILTALQNLASKTDNAQSRSHNANNFGHDRL
jgi:hypothetical protein